MQSSLHTSSYMKYNQRESFKKKFVEVGKEKRIVIDKKTSKGIQTRHFICEEASFKEKCKQTSFPSQNKLFFVEVFFSPLKICFSKRSWHEILFISSRFLFSLSGSHKTRTNTTNEYIFFPLKSFWLYCRFIKIRWIFYSNFKKQYIF